MKNQTSLLRWAGLIALALVVSVACGHKAWAASGATPAKAEGRADVVTIDAMAKDGKLQLPPVTFLHDQHTKALAKQGKDCTACHERPKAGSEAFAFTYKNAASLKGDALKTMYHNSCISCHNDSRGKGKTGPLEAECRTCHDPRPVKNDGWNDIGFDKVLHFKHAADTSITYPGDKEKNCGACHHVYDSAARNLTWGKNKEDSCRACHLLPDEKAATLKANPYATDENGELKKRPTLDNAAHTACVNCHFTTAAKKVESQKVGPVDCAGCHSLATKEKLAAQAANPVVAGSIPRLERGQADAVLMMPEAPPSAAPAAATTSAAPAPAAPAVQAKEIKTSMSPVAFNHKYHEQVSKDCRTCHHKKIASCSSCHSLEGKAEGDFVNFAQAMHSQKAEQSCVSCHAAQVKDASCAGCHAAMPRTLQKDSCVKCHSLPVGVKQEQAESGALLQLDKDSRNALAAATVAERDRLRVTTFDKNDIPEKVTIGLLAKDFEPSEMPHRKIVETLLDKQSKNRLAAAFHTDKATLCQGCHHNSPPSKTPPKCVSCHPVAGQSDDGRPALKAAYHLQCMNCHAGMAQKPAETQCADCHKIRGNK